MNSVKNEIDAQLSEVGKVLELPISRRWDKSNYEYEFTIRLQELPAPLGLEVLVGDDFLNWHFETKLDDFAKPTLELCRTSFNQDPEAILGYCELAQMKSKNFKFLVNGMSIFDLPKETKWDDLQISMTRTYANLAESMPALKIALIDLLAIILSLTNLTPEMRTPQEETNHDESGFKEEGSESEVLCKKYERSRFNRQLCLSYYGFRCRACNKLMAEVYGQPGTSVIHVHHIIPVSLMGGSKTLNPIRDLVPLCPNCHNVAHRKHPPYTLSELRDFLEVSE
jgi:5-methylcytosine-specific restriction protein A